MNFLKISSFRGIQDLTLESLARVNFLVGLNNCGKTSVLESVLLANDPSNTYTWLDLIDNRDTSAPEALKWLFYQDFNEAVGQFIPRPIRIESDLFEVACSLSSYIGNWKLAQLKLESDRIQRRMEFLHQQHQVENEKEDLGKLIDREKERLDALEQDVFALQEMTPEFKNIYKVAISQVQNNPISEAVVHEERESNTFFEFTEGDINFSTLQNGDTEFDRFQFGEIGFPFKNQKTAFVRTASGRTRLKQRQFFSQLTQLSVNNKKEQIIEILRWFNSNIVDVEILSPNGITPCFYIKHQNGSSHPLSAYGDGVKHVLDLALALLRSENGCLLIDEIETGLHTSTLQPVFQWLLKTAQKLNNQIFITTHSLEILDALLSEGSSETSTDEKLSEIAVYRLEKSGNITKAFRYSGAEYQSARMDFGMDVR